MILFGVLSDLESPEYWLNKLELIFKERLGTEVGGNDDLLMLKIEVSSFGLSSAGVLVSPNLEVVADGRCIQVFDKDNLLTKVTVEPLVLLFDVGVWVSSSSIVRLAGVGDTPVPLSTNVGSTEGFEL